MLKVYILIVVLGLVGGVVYGGYYYYKDTQARIQTLTENSAKLETGAEEPAVWERKINNASKRVLEDFESITAHPSTK